VKLISSVTDLRTEIDGWTGSPGWGDSTAPENCLAAENDEVLRAAVETLRVREHPLWGDDWEEWLEAVNLEQLHEEAFQDVRNECGCGCNEGEDGS
jgi:hypothetical protein